MTSMDIGMFLFGYVAVSLDYQLRNKTPSLLIPSELIAPLFCEMGYLCEEMIKSICARHHLPKTLLFLK